MGELGKDIYDKYLKLFRKDVEDLKNAAKTNKYKIAEAQARLDMLERCSKQFQNRIEAIHELTKSNTITCECQDECSDVCRLMFYPDGNDSKADSRFDSRDACIAELKKSIVNVFTNSGILGKIKQSQKEDDDEYRDAFEKAAEERRKANDKKFELSRKNAKKTRNQRKEKKTKTLDKEKKTPS